VVPFLNAFYKPDGKPEPDRGLHLGKLARSLPEDFDRPSSWDTLAFASLRVIPSKEDEVAILTKEMVSCVTDNIKRGIGQSQEVAIKDHQAKLQAGGKCAFVTANPADDNFFVVYENLPVGATRSHSISFIGKTHSGECGEEKSNLTPLTTHR